MNAPKRVLITGASRGIGKAAALAFGKEKYCVGINYVRSEKEAKLVSEEIASFGGTPLLLKADIGNSSQVKEMVQTIIDRWGKIDVLVNNAGVARDRTILKMTDDEWNEVVQTNLTGSFWCLRECAKIMAKKREGSIINIASISGVRGSFGNANYSASKGGVIALTKSAARELGRFNIRVNALLPGYHLTELGMKIPEKYREPIRLEHTLERFADIDELAQFILSLSKNQSTSGQIFNFDSRIM